MSIHLCYEIGCFKEKIKTVLGVSASKMLKIFEIEVGLGRSWDNLLSPQKEKREKKLKKIKKGVDKRGSMW